MVALRTPPVIQGQIVTRRAAGQSMRQIARELGVDRETVKRVEDAHGINLPDATVAEQARLLIPKALDSLDRHIPEDGGLAMRYLEATIFKDHATGNVTFNDAKLNVAIGMLPPPRTQAPPDAPIDVTSYNASPSPCNNVTEPTEAAEKGPGHTDTNISRTNFSPILEPAPRFTGFDDIPG